MKKTIILFLALLCLSCAGDDGSRQEKRLRVMSYNVHNCVGLDGTRNIPRVADVISKYSPDVVALQEIDSMTNRSKYDLTWRIAVRAGYNGYFAPAIPHTGGKYGVAILSKRPVKSIKQYELPCSNEIRTLAVAEFDDFYFICTHWSLIAEYRLQAVEIVREVLSGLKKPVILAGDLNATPTSEPIKKLSEFMTILNDTSKFTFNAKNPSKCIDYVVGAGASFEVEKTFVGYGCEASDHLPVYVDIVMKKL